MDTPFSGPTLVEVEGRFVRVLVCWVSATVVEMVAMKTSMKGEGKATVLTTSSGDTVKYISLVYLFYLKHKLLILQDLRASDVNTFASTLLSL